MAESRYTLAVQNLEERLTLLLQKYIHQQKTIKQLTQEHAKLEQLLREQNKATNLSVGHLSDQLKAVSTSLSSERLVDKFDIYIRAIDSCIAILERL